MNVFLLLLECFESFEPCTYSTSFAFGSFLPAQREKSKILTSSMELLRSNKCNLASVPTF